MEQVFALGGIPDTLEPIDWTCEDLAISPPYTMKKARVISALMREYQVNKPAVALLKAQNYHKMRKCRCCVEQEKDYAEVEVQEDKTNVGFNREMQIDSHDAIRNEDKVEEIDENRDGRENNLVETVSRTLVIGDKGQSIGEGQEKSFNYQDEPEGYDEAFKGLYYNYLSIIASLARDRQYNIREFGKGWFSYAIARQGYKLVRVEARHQVFENPTKEKRSRIVSLLINVPKDYVLTEEELKHDFLVYSRLGDVHDMQISQYERKGTTARLYVKGSFSRQVILKPIPRYKVAMTRVNSGKYLPQDRRHKAMFDEMGISNYGIKKVGEGYRDLFTGQDHYEPINGRVMGKRNDEFAWRGQKFKFKYPEVVLNDDKSLVKVKCEYRRKITYRVHYKDGVPMVRMIKKRVRILAYDRFSKCLQWWVVRVPVQDMPGFWYIEREMTEIQED